MARSKLDLIYAQSKDLNVMSTMFYIKAEEGDGYIYIDEACTIKATADDVIDAYIKRTLIAKIMDPAMIAIVGFTYVSSGNLGIHTTEDGEVDYAYLDIGHIHIPDETPDKPGLTVQNRAYTDGFVPG